MGQARLTRRAAWGALALALGCCGAGAAPGAGRFASYGTEADCAAAGAFTPGACRVAFAAAQAEYAARTPSFAARGPCERRYPSCMAWPPGVRGAARFRPAWTGVDIVDTPAERSATPSPGGAGGAVRFAARPLDAEPARLTIRGAAVPVPPPRRPGAAPAAVRHAGANPAPSPPPPAGSGFKLEDGVLTFPAPARFQPRNLPPSR